MIACKKHLKILSFGWLAVIIAAILNGVVSGSGSVLCEIAFGLILFWTGFFMVLHRHQLQEVWPGRPIAKDPAAVLVIGVLWMIGGMTLLAFFGNGLKW